uniref:Gamma-crystallin M2-like n=1 Tax=Scleropages formosus TaxID=113540 RepID=A0A8D0CKJ9_SCLFO
MAQFLCTSEITQHCYILSHSDTNERDFQGRSHECMSDCADLHSYFNRCNSIRVESAGCWVLYERPNYMGYQYILTPGEYPDYQHWMGFNDSIRSCRCVYGKVYKIRLYEKPDFGGKMVEHGEDCPSVQEAFKLHEIHSCIVLDGAWAFYNESNYKGRQYFLERGEYRQHEAWGATSPAVGSFRRITKF